MKTIIEYVQPGCPYCNYVYHNIIRDILVRRDILNRKMKEQKKKQHIPFFDIRKIDIKANEGVSLDQWFRWYSNRKGGIYTPIVRVNDEGFYLWIGEKSDKLEKEKLSRSDKLKSEIITALIKDDFEKKVPLYDKDLMHHARGF